MSGLSQNGIDDEIGLGKQIVRMQLIRAVPVDEERYVAEGFHRQVCPPPQCPHCQHPHALWAHGFYRRNISRLQRGHLRLWIRRFLCRFCRKTVSVLPSFAQPYRLSKTVQLRGLCEVVPGLMMSSGSCLAPALLEAVCDLSS